jgi:hypothetical protein
LIRSDLFNFSYRSNRRVAWWNEDGGSPEADEEYIIHCAEFGKGVDEVKRKLASDWLAYVYSSFVARLFFLGT